MPGVKRQRAEVDGPKVNDSKKVKVSEKALSKADKKFAVKLVTKDKKSSKDSRSKDKSDKTNRTKKNKKQTDPEDLDESDTTEYEKGFQGLSVAEDQLNAEEDTEEGGVDLEVEPEPKPKKYEKDAAGQITGSVPALKGSTDGANGKKHHAG
jgi:hypothetical protein